MYDKLNWYCKAVINQLEINNFKKEREMKWTEAQTLQLTTEFHLKKLYNFRKQQKIYMAFGLGMSSNTQQKSQLT